MKYIKPNFNYEWHEAKRYPEFRALGKKEWIEYAKNHYKITLYNTIEDILNNIDLDFDNLNKDKKQRFNDAFESGKVEMPIAVKFDETDYDLVGGNTRLAGLIKKGINPKIWVIDMSEIMENKQNHLDEMKKMKNPCWKGYKAYGMKKKNGKMVPNCVPIDEAQETDESTMAGSAGAFSAALDFSPPPHETKTYHKIMGSSKSNNKKTSIPNVDRYRLSESEDEEEEEAYEQEMGEATTSASSGQYTVPAWGTSPKGRKDPLAIDGPKSIGKSRAVKDKNWPKFGGPGGVYVQVKEKCKKFPYCNQGDINAIQPLKEAIEAVAIKRGIPVKEIENLVLNEIKQIFI
jgi:hypothetical protein